MGSSVSPFRGKSVTNSGNLPSQRDLEDRENDNAFSNSRANEDSQRLENKTKMSFYTPLP
jgi:hypothetical protein